MEHIRGALFGGHRAGIQKTMACEKLRGISSFLVPEESPENGSENCSETRLMIERDADERKCTDGRP
jgi:hypothetical protein